MSLFCILESTGISLLSALTKYKLNQTEQQMANDDESKSERNEVKESKVKEYLLSDFLIEAPLLTFIEATTYPQRQQHAHLAWVPPVPTPPPNRIV
ncbi:hypothetical protein [Mucilaginibacter antarcticus]|uniref:Uncharacterized protein n=1 Tax=Mucilaginibacter antarcticus TaxID=1855725 RepID=A0ABW5XV37_9SPHI